MTVEGEESGLVCTELPREDVERIIKIVRDRLPEDAEIVILSFTGSRAFGWGSIYHDIDVRGIFAKKDWWDWVHIGIEKYDITLYELRHLFYCVEHRYFPIYYDLAKPIYINPKFDYKTFLKLLSAENIRMHMYTIKLERQRFRLRRHARSALHCYKERLIPLYWLKTGKLEVNIWVLSDYFNLKYPKILANAYANRKPVDVNWDEVEKELDELEMMLEEELKKRRDVLDWDLYITWRRKMELVFYGETTVR